MSTNVVNGSGPKMIYSNGNCANNNVEKRKNSPPPKVYIGPSLKEFDVRSNDSLDGNQ